MSDVLILTATVTPSAGQGNLRISSPEQRFVEYLASLKYYVDHLSGHDIRIIFVENSGFDLSIFKAHLPKNEITFYSAKSTESLNGVHRGWAEFVMIDEVHEKVLANLDDHVRIFKITGRYIVKNLVQFIRWSPNKFDIYCDSRNGWIELSVIAYTQIGWRSFVRPLIPELHSHLPTETILYSLLSKLSELNIVSCYYLPPIIVGVRGTNGVSYRGRLWLLRYAWASIKGLMAKIGLVHKSL